MNSKLACLGGCEQSSMVFGKRWELNVNRLSSQLWSKWKHRHSKIDLSLFNGELMRSLCHQAEVTKELSGSVLR